MLRLVAIGVATGFVAGIGCAVVIPAKNLVEAERLSTIQEDVRVETSGSSIPDTQIATFSGSGVFSDRLKRFLEVDQLEEPDRLTAELQVALRASPPSVGSWEIDSLLGKLFEVSPNDARDFVQSVDLPTDTLASAFRLWAQIDTQRALEFLGSVGV